MRSDEDARGHGKGTIHRGEGSSVTLHRRVRGAPLLNSDTLANFDTTRRRFVADSSPRASRIPPAGPRKSVLIGERKARLLVAGTFSSANSLRSSSYPALFSPFPSRAGEGEGGGGPFRRATATGALTLSFIFDSSHTSRAGILGSTSTTTAAAPPSDPLVPHPLAPLFFCSVGPTPAPFSVTALPPIAEGVFLAARRRAISA